MEGVERRPGLEAVPGPHLLRRHVVDLGRHDDLGAPPAERERDGCLHESVVRASPLRFGSDRVEGDVRGGCGDPGDRQEADDRAPSLDDEHVVRLRATHRQCPLHVALRGGVLRKARIDVVVAGVVGEGCARDGLHAGLVRLDDGAHLVRPRGCADQRAPEVHERIHQQEPGAFERVHRGQGRRRAPRDHQVGGSAAEELDRRARALRTVDRGAEGADSEALAVQRRRLDSVGEGRHGSASTVG